MVANSEKAIGLFYAGNLVLDFDRNPGAKDYKPKHAPKEILQKMSDGGLRRNIVEDKRNAIIKFKFIDASFRDSLFSVYKRSSGFNFVAFPTTTGWDEFMFDGVWSGTFDFFRFSDDAPSTGFSGQIKLSETPR
jgi:hypothetical protein